MLYEAREMVKGISTVNFVFADLNGDLKVRFNEADRGGRFVFGFKSVDDLAMLIRGLDYHRFEDEPCAKPEDEPPSDE